MAFCSLLIIIFAITAYVSSYYVPSGSTQILSTSQNNSSSIRIVFASCYDGIQEIARTPGMNIMEDIAKEGDNSNLDLMIWLGDFAYVDQKVLKRYQKIWERILERILRRIPMGVTMYQKFGGFFYVQEEDRRFLFNLTYSNSFYKQLREKTAVIGVWDDHDYGMNDGDASNPIKVEQKQIFLDYIDEPKESERRLRGNDKGIYTHYRFTKGQLQILAILLDVRYENTGDSTISESQWLWLENQLKEAVEMKDDVILIGSGVQFLMNNRFINAEHWHPQEIKRMLQLINSYIANPKRVIFISGDVHHGQLLSSGCRLSQNRGERVVEVTSSGMTHTCDRNLFRLCTYALEGNTPEKFQNSKIAVDYNYGLLEILQNPQTNDVTVNIQVKGRNNTILLLSEVVIPGNFSKSHRDLKFCDNHVFGKDIIIFEKLLYHVPKTLIFKKNLFLLFGINFLIIAVSGMLTCLIWVPNSKKTVLECIQIYKEWKQLGRPIFNIKKLIILYKKKGEQVQTQQK